MHSFSFVRIVTALIALLVAAIFHEFAHGYVAYCLGDDTAKQQGRLTLNPIAHIDPIGTLLLPALIIIFKLPFVFGWAKPVPVNFYKLGNPKRDMIVISAAGPISNILLSLIFAFCMKMLILSGVGSGFIYTLFLNLVVINIVIALFNLIPIPPLDGSRILMGILPSSWAVAYAKIEPFGILIVCFLLWRGVLGKLLLPALSWILSLYGIY